MGLLDMFKKKSQDSPESTPNSPVKGLDELPPIPQDPLTAPSNPSSSDDLLPTPDSSLGSDLPPLDEPSLEVPSPEELPSPSLAEESGLESALDADPTDLSSDSLPDDTSSLSSEPDPGLEVPQPTSSDMDTDLSSDSSMPGIEEAVASATSLPPDENSDQEDSSQESEAPKSFEELPDFSADEGIVDQTDFTQDIQEQESQQTSVPSSSSITQDDEMQARVRTESLLLKSIFVEREHYANIIFSVRRVKDDLQNSSPQQRKLAHVDMKLAKEYGKLSALFEGFNENLMIVEHILSKEQF